MSPVASSHPVALLSAVLGIRQKTGTGRPIALLSLALISFLLLRTLLPEVSRTLFGGSEHTVELFDVAFREGLPDCLWVRFAIPVHSRAQFVQQLSAGIHTHCTQRLLHGNSDSVFVVFSNELDGLCGAFVGSTLMGTDAFPPMSSDMGPFVLTDSLSVDSPIFL